MRSLVAAGCLLGMRLIFVCDDIGEDYSSRFNRSTRVINPSHLQARRYAHRAHHFDPQNNS